MDERRQAAGLVAKKEDIIAADFRIEEAALAFGGQRPNLPPGDGLCKRCPVVMMGNAGKLGVIQPGAAQATVVPGKTERVDEVQGGAGVGAEADDAAGIGGDLWLLEGDVHGGG